MTSHQDKVFLFSGTNVCCELLFCCLSEIYYRDLVLLNLTVVVVDEKFIHCINKEFSMNQCRHLLSIGIIINDVTNT